MQLVKLYRWCVRLLQGCLFLRFWLLRIRNKACIKYALDMYNIKKQEILAVINCWKQISPIVSIFWICVFVMDSIVAEDTFKVRNLETILEKKYFAVFYLWLQHAADSLLFEFQGKKIYSNYRKIRIIGLSQLKIEL